MDFTPDYSIWNQIDHFVMDTVTNEAVGNTILRLYYANKEHEAIIYIKDFFECDDDTAKDAFEIFKGEMGEPPSPQQIAHANAVARESLNKPNCPTCNSTNVQKISTGERVTSVAILGLFSKKINKSFKCKNCGHTW